MGKASLLTHVKTQTEIQGLLNFAGGPSSLLVLTNSLDGSSDIIVELCKDAKVDVFRFNIDLFEDYEIKFSKDTFIIADPVNRRVDLLSDNYRLLWRKPFLDLVNRDSMEEVNPIVRGQYQSLLRTMVELAKSRKLLSVVEPYGEQRLPKLRQLDEARHLFSVPDYEFSVQESRLKSKLTVTKPLGDPSTLGNSVFYTSIVQSEDLERPFPWFLQEAIVGGIDITGVYIDGKTWFFESDFERGASKIDWRTEINSSHQSRWKAWNNGTSMDLQARVYKLMTNWQLRYGRLDFILAENDQLWFLECNPNGQFGWLDDGDLTLHRAFLASAIK